MHRLIALLVCVYASLGIMEVYDGNEPLSSTSPLFVVGLNTPVNGTTLYPHVYYSEVNNSNIPSYVNDIWHNQTVSWIEFGQESNDVVNIWVCVNIDIMGYFIYTNESPYVLPIVYGISRSNINVYNSSCLEISNVKGNELHFSLEYNTTLTNSFKHSFLVFIGDLDPYYNASDDTILYFPPGVHTITNSNDRNSILSTGHYNTIYIARGSWVYGKIEVTSKNNNRNKPFNIIGHGVLDGSGFDYTQRNTNNIDHAAMINVTTWSKSIHLKGITCYNPSNWCVTCLTPNSIINQYRVIAWYYNNDGMGLASNSTMTNSFIRTNDDSVKLNCGGNKYIDNIVIEQLYNGSPFQIGWNSVGCINCSVNNSTIIHANWMGNKGAITPQPNDAVINMDYSMGSSQENANFINISFNNIYVDDHVGRLFGITLDNNNAVVTVDGIQINNLISRKELQFFLNDQNTEQFINIASKNGKNTVNNIEFNNVMVNGMHIINDDMWNLQFLGNTSLISNVSYM